MIPSKALVVLSGGQDSSTCLFWAVKRYGAENVHAITFDYDQRHQREINAAKSVASLARVYDRHEVLKLGPILEGASPLTNHELDLEEYESHDEMEKIIGNRVEKTFVPMRNALFLTLAANRAAVHRTHYIVTGVCQADNANYPDCRQEFIAQQEKAINTALGNEFERNWIMIETPLMNMSKAESIRLACSLPGAYSALAYTHTAYDGQFPPTGKDHATVLRAHGFEEADLPDPLVLRAWKIGEMDLPTTPNYRPDKIDKAMAVMRAELERTSFLWWWAS